MSNTVVSMEEYKTTAKIGLSVGCENCYDDRKVEEIRMVLKEKPDVSRYLFECPKCQHQVLVTLDI